MEQTKNLSWFLGHILFTCITVCTLRGGYLFYEDVKRWRGIEYDLTALDNAAKAALAEQLIVDGFSVPRNIPKIK